MSLSHRTIDRSTGKSLQTMNCFHLNGQGRFPIVQGIRRSLDSTRCGKKKALVKMCQRRRDIARGLLAAITNPTDHSFVISSKTDRKQNGDVSENNGRPALTPFSPLPAPIPGKDSLAWVARPARTDPAPVRRRFLNAAAASGGIYQRAAIRR